MDSDGWTNVDVVVQLYAGILLGVMGTDVPLADFLDTVPHHKVHPLYLGTSSAIYRVVRKSQPEPYYL